MKQCKVFFKIDLMCRRHDDIVKHPLFFSLVPADFLERFLRSKDIFQRIVELFREIFVCSSGSIRLALNLD